MEYVYLLLAMLGSALLSIFSTAFKLKTADKKNIVYLYNLAVSLSAFLCWGIIALFDMSFNIRVMGYSVLYGIFYAMAMFGMFKALQTGSVSLTAFIKQLSLIGVALWGFVFWETKITVNVAVGIALITVALYLCFMPEKESGKKSFSAEWLFYCVMLLVGNAGCSIVQKYQQLAFKGESDSTFMFFGSLFSAVVCAVLYFSNERCKFGDIRKSLLLYPFFGGMSSAGLNLFIMLLISTFLSESVIFPGIAVGGLTITIIASAVAFKEKLKCHEWAGLAVGSVALVLLNI